MVLWGGGGGCMYTYSVESTDAYNDLVQQRPNRPNVNFVVIALQWTMIVHVLHTYMQ